MTIGILFSSPADAIASKDAKFAQFRGLIHRIAGINATPQTTMNQHLSN